MKLSIEGTPEEIKNALQAICGSEEREGKLPLNSQKLSELSDSIQRENL